MKKHATHFSKILFGLGGASVAALLAAGCATESGGVLTGSMTPEQYAQLSEQQCVGVPAKEQEEGILAYRDAIAGAQTLKDPYQVGKMKLTRDAGVAFGVRAQPNLNGPWLERVATCHMALARSGRITTSASDPFAGRHSPRPGCPTESPASTPALCCRIRVFAVSDPVVKCP